jgi:hypothetical protein
MAAMGISLAVTQVRGLGAFLCEKVAKALFKPSHSLAQVQGE